jgi:ankyrin repeat protein
MLFDNDADVHACNRMGCTALHDACKYSNDVETAEALVRKGGDLFAKDSVIDSHTSSCFATMITPIPIRWHPKLLLTHAMVLLQANNTPLDYCPKEAFRQKLLV